MLATFSLHTVVNDVGAYCGLAALVGLALLALLYFAQARELRRLSDWIEDEQERRRSASAGPTVVARGVPLPPQAAGVPPQAAGVVTTAVPGVRRVAVPAAGAVPVAPAPTAVLAPSTAAGIAAVAPAEPQSPVEAADLEPAATPGADGEQPLGEDARLVATPVAASGGAPALELSGAGALAPDEEAGAQDAEPPTGEEQAVGAAALGGAQAGGELAGLEAAPAPREDADVAPTVTRAGDPAAVPPPGDADAAGKGAQEWPADESQAPRRPSVAVPLNARRVPIAEPRDAMRGGGDPRAAPLSQFDLLRAGSPVREEPVVDEALQEGAPLAPATAAGQRPRFPPPPPAGSPPRVAPPPPPPPLRDDEMTVRVPGRVGGPPTDGTERTRRRVRDPDDEFSEPPRSLGSTLRLLAAAIVIVAILIFVATRLFSSSPSKPSGSHSTTSSSSTTTGKTTTSNAAGAGFVASRITVAVLNGTATSHLASGAMAVLAGKGFHQGMVSNAPAHVSTSLVGYTHLHHRAARVVAADLGLPPSDVHPVDHASLVFAERNGSRPQVVVTLGSDYTPQG